MTGDNPDDQTAKADVFSINPNLVAIYKSKFC